MTANLLVTYGSDFGAARKLLTLPRLTMLPRPRLRVPERGEKNDRGSCVVIALDTARVQLKEPLTLMLWQRSNSAVVVSYDRSRSEMETLKSVIARWRVFGDVSGETHPSRVHCIINPAEFFQCPIDHVLY